MKKKEVAEFGFFIEDNLFSLYRELARGEWRAAPYVQFRVADPKPRQIHKASVRDRVLFQAVFRILYPIFDKTFIHDLYSSRIGKGTLAGALRFEKFARKASRNYTRQIFVLKCDVRKFFDVIDHSILLELLAKRVSDTDLLGLVEKIIRSFKKTPGKGLPLGNVTSQLFSNVYLNGLDQYVKRMLKERFYIRYCDDFVIVNDNREQLEKLIPRVSQFLETHLRLVLHPDKVNVRTLLEGTDFLGHVALPGYRALRTRTKRRIFKNYFKIIKQIREGNAAHEYGKRILNSYKGMLIHSRGYRLWKRLEQMGEQVKFL